MPARTANADALLARRIRELAQPTRLPDGRELSVLPFFDAKDLARSLGRSRKPLSPDGRRRPPGRAVARVERAALAAGVMPERYLRNFDCYSLDEQLRLLSSRAAMLSSPASTSELTFSKDTGGRSLNTSTSAGAISGK